MFFTLGKVLITGGAGFIGSHLVKEYLELGSEVTVLDNLQTGSILKVQNQNINFVNGDIRDDVLVNELVSKNDLILHMAAAVGVDNILNNTLDSISVNIFGSEIVLRSAARHRKRIVIASTSEVYGKNPLQPLSETADRVVGTPQLIRWSYSDAKAIEEAIATTLYRTHKLEVTVIRFFNTVGLGQTGRYGMVLPRFVKSALNGDSLRVFGSGNQTRVFGHVHDAVKALVKLAQTNNAIGEVYNVGGVGEISINDLARKVIERTGSSSDIVHVPYAEAYEAGYEDIGRRVPNIEKVKILTGWAPIKSLDQIIDDVEQYIRLTLD